MSRASYCHEQAVLCRTLARQISNRADVKKVPVDQADRYEAEARMLETEQVGPSGAAEN